MNLYDEIETVENVPPESIMQGVRVIYADDAQDILDFLAHITKMMGWEGQYARTAKGLIDQVNLSLENNEKIDAVVADINYFQSDEDPRVTGITAAKQIRKILPNVPIIFITGYVTTIIKEEVRRVDAEIFKKPFDFINLFTRVSQLIYWHRLAERSEYDGEDRRRNSVNQTEFRRRATDKFLQIPTRISNIIKEVRDERRERDSHKREIPPYVPDR